MFLFYFILFSIEKVIIQMVKFWLILKRF